MTPPNRPRLSVSRTLRLADAPVALPAAAVLVALAAASPVVRAQTQSTWVGRSTDVDPDGTGPLGLTEGFARYNNPANWSNGVVPRNAGDVATFDGSGARSVYLDTAGVPSGISLGRIEFFSPQGTFLTPAPRTPAGPADPVPASGASITLSGPAIIDARNTPLSTRVPGVFDPVNIVFVPIRGTAGLTKTGDGLLALTAANPFTGGLRLQGGRLVTAGPAGLSGDLILGAPGGTVSLDNAAQLVLVSNTTTARPFFTGTGGGEIVVNPGTQFTHNGLTAGAGPLTIRGGARTLTGTTDLSAPLTLRGGTTLSGNGTFGNTPVVTAEGDLRLGPVGTTAAASTNPNRFGNSAALALRGNRVDAATNTAAGGFNESIGTTAIEGTTAIVLRTSGSTTSTLNLGTLDRRNRAGLYLGGANLGQSAPGTAGQASVTVSNPSDITFSTESPFGGLVPWAYANPVAPAGGAYGIEDPNLTSVRYRTSTGFYAEPTSMQVTRITAPSTAATTVRLTADQVLTPGSANQAWALILADGASPDGQGLTVSDGGSRTARVNVGGGEVLSAFAGVTTTGNRPNTLGNTIDVALDFGSNEAVFNTPAALRVSGDITGTNGLTKNGNQSLYLTGTPKTFTGPVTVNGGAVVVEGGTSGPLGLGSDTIQFYGGTASQAPDGSAVSLGVPADVTDPLYGTPSAGLEVRYGPGSAAAGSPLAGKVVGFVSRRLAFDGPGGGFLTNAGQPIAGQAGIGLQVYAPITVAAGSSLTLTRPVGSDLDGVDYAARATDVPTIIGANGPISGGGALRIEDSQRVLLQANSIYSGGTTINPGGTRVGGFDPIIDLGSAAPFGTGPVTVEGPATLRTVSGGVVNLPNAIDLNDAALGRTALTFENANPLGLSGVVDARNAPDGSRTFLAFDGTAAVTVSGPVIGDGFIRTGTGTLVLSGQNTFRDTLFLGFTGANNVPLPGGTTVVRSNGALGVPANGVQVVTGNTLEFDGQGAFGGGLSTGQAVDDFGRKPLLVVRGTGVGGGATGGPNGVGAVRSVNGANGFGGDVLLSRSAGGSAQASVNVLAAGDRLDVGGAVASDPAAPAGLRKTGLGTLSAGRLELSSLNVASGRVQLAPTAATGRPAGRDASILQSIPTFGSANPTAQPQLDLTNGAVLIDVAVPVPGSAIRTLIRSAYDGAGGAWTGPGITTSAGDLTRLGLGYLDGADLPASSLAADNTFAGVVPASGDVVIALTLFGDADLDGRVTKADFLRLVADFGRGVAGNPDGGGAGTGLWGGGDFNYDGAVNGADLNLLIGNFGATVSGGVAGVSAADRVLVSAFAASVGAGMPVPEPAGLAGLIGGAFLLARRRRRGA